MHPRATRPSEVGVSREMKPLIIDMHTHIRRGRGTLDQFVAAMDECGLDMAGVAAIVPTEPEVGESTNEFVYECVARHPDRLFGWCCVIPYDPDAPRELERCVKEMGFKGLKLHPPIQGFSATDPRIFPTIRKAIELDVPILFHTGPIYVQMAKVRHGDPADFDELAMIFPEAKMVLGHGDPLGIQPVIAGKHPNVYMDTSITFTRVVRYIPGIAEDVLLRRTTGVTQLADKVMLGSDAAPTFPERFRESVEAIQGLKIPEEVKAKVLGENAARLLKLSIQTSA